MSSQLVTRFDGADWVNDLTKEMDSYFTNKEHSRIWRTYLYEPQKASDNCYVIRVPGATRGGIYVDKKMIIKDIRLCEDTCFIKSNLYSRDILKIFKKYIGMELVIR